MKKHEIISITCHISNTHFAATTTTHNRSLHDLSNNWGNFYLTSVYTINTVSICTLIHVVFFIFELY